LSNNELLYREESKVADLEEHMLNRAEDDSEYDPNEDMDRFNDPSALA
jgi:hypothetical protein